MPVVSLIMPVFNGQSTLKRSVDSILAQSFNDFELIIINDGSTDDSQVICENYSRIDSRVKLINTINQGAGPARNIGLECAKGKYVMFPDCDDWLEYNMIEILVNNIEKKGIDFVISGSTNYDNFLKIKNINIDIFQNDEIYLNNEDILKNYIILLERGLASGPSDKIYKLDMIKSRGLKFPDLRRSQDMAFNINYFKISQGLVVVNKPLYNYVCGDSKDFYRKIPQNYIDVVDYLLSSWNDMLSMVNDNVVEFKWKKYMAGYALGSVYVYICSLYIKKDKISRRELRKYLDNVMSSEMIYKAVLDSNPRKISTKLFVYAMKRKSRVLLLVLIKAREFLVKFYGLNHSF